MQDLWPKSGNIVTRTLYASCFVLKIDVFTQNKGQLTTSAAPGQSFLDLFFRLQLSFHKYFCAGSGLCGQCAMQFLSNAPIPHQADLVRFTPAQIDNGWRLACRHVVHKACAVRVFDELVSVPSVKPGEALVVDIGTTQIKWAAMNALEEERVYQSSNPQLAIGADVMSRLVYAMQSKAAQARLQKSLVLPLQKILQTDFQPKFFGIAGNTVMISLLLNLPLQGLAMSPYHISWKAGTMTTMDRLPLPFYIPPLFGPFIGADVSAGLAYIQTLSPSYPFLFIDVGTNAEFILALSPGSYFACSVPMGPAIEGVGLSCGAIAGDQVLTKIDTSLHELLERKSFADCVGISGSGYIALIADLYRSGALDTQGHFISGLTPLSKLFSSRLQTKDTGRELALTDSLFISERDVEEVLKVKAVFSLAVKILLQRAGISFPFLQKVYLSGAFGSNININDLITVGFLPLFAQEKTEQIPNTVLKGLFLALTRSDTQAWLHTLSSQVAVVDIVLEKDFNQKYAQSIGLGWA